MPRSLSIEETSPSSILLLSASSKEIHKGSSSFAGLSASQIELTLKDDNLASRGLYDITSLPSDVNDSKPANGLEAVLPQRTTCFDASIFRLDYRGSFQVKDMSHTELIHNHSTSDREPASASQLEPRTIPFEDPGVENASASTGDDDDEDLDHVGDSQSEGSANEDTRRYSGASGAEAASSYDLKAPPPASKSANIEFLSERLFSLDHLKIVLNDVHIYASFSAFLHKYQVQSAQALSRYLEMQKGLSAIDYANAIAEELNPGSAAAEVDRTFLLEAGELVKELVNDALPKFITYRLVRIATETLVKEITRQSTPIMREMLGGLAEVYCMTDPNLPDNPIVYASEDFHRATQYGRGYVVGRNCRFLQGPKTLPASVQRLSDAMFMGKEICETILNYRRDGTPFMNLLMIAPLHDNKGNVRYFIGAQIDVTGLITNGHGLDSFQRLLGEDKTESEHAEQPSHIKGPHKALGNLSALFDDTDMSVVKKCSYHPRESSSSSVTESSKSRKLVGVDVDESMDQTMWPAGHLGHNGRLPGVFQNYLLVRPHPSMRIIFTSPSLRIPGLVQSKFLDRIGGSARIRDEITEAFSTGISVTARVHWLPQGAASDSSSSKDYSANESSILNSRGKVVGRDSFVNERSRKLSGVDSMIVGPDGQPGKPRWIHCTPLLGSDEKIGVWMVVLVESEFVTGGLNVSERAAAAKLSSQLPRAQEMSQNRTVSAVNATEGSAQSYLEPGTTNPKRVSRRDKLRGSKLYQDYLRREGRPQSAMTDGIADGEVGFQGLRAR